MLPTFPQIDANLQSRQIITTGRPRFTLELIASSSLPSLAQANGELVRVLSMWSFRNFPYAVASTITRKGMVDQKYR